MAALVRIAANIRAVFAAHVTFQLVDGRRLRSEHDIVPQSDVYRSRGSGPQGRDIRVESIAQRRGGLRRAFVPEHPLVPYDTG
jgi:hypothetical protein